MAFRARYIGNINTNYPLVNGNEYDIILLNSDVYFETIQFHVINTGYDFQMESNNLYPINEIEYEKMIEDRLRIKLEMKYHRNVKQVIYISDSIILNKGNIYNVEEYRNMPVRDLLKQYTDTKGVQGKEKAAEAQSKSEDAKGNSVAAKEKNADKKQARETEQVRVEDPAQETAETIRQAAQGSPSGAGGR